MKKLALLILFLLIMSVDSMAQSIVRTFTLDANNQNGPVIPLIGTGVYLHKFTWNEVGTITGGECGLVGGPDGILFPTTIIASEFVTSSGGPTDLTSNLSNYVKITCTTPITGTGSVTFNYVGSAADTSVSISTSGLATEITLGATNTALGTTTTAATTAGGAGPVIGHLRFLTGSSDLTRIASEAMLARMNSTGVVMLNSAGGAIGSIDDVCYGATKTPFNVRATSTTVVELVPAVSAKTGYICELHVRGSGAAAVEILFSIVDGTNGGTHCSSGTPVALLGTTTASEGVNIAASGGGSNWGNGNSVVFKTTGINRQICGKLGGSTPAIITGTYVAP